MPQTLVKLNDVGLTLTSRAGRVEILKSVNLEVDTGTALGIVGPSGSGKTSLLMIMGGLESATSGSVKVAGQDFSNMNEDALALARGQNIGIVFQSFHLVPTMTALENVALPLEFLNLPDPFDIAAEALNDVELSHRLSHFPSQLSGGEQQRVALARAIAPRPKLLLADEPTGNLDVQTGEHVMELIFDLRERHGATLILVTHDQRLAEQCTRIVRMHDGQIVKEKIPELV